MSWGARGAGRRRAFLERACLCAARRGRAGGGRAPAPPLRRASPPSARRPAPLAPFPRAVAAARLSTRGASDVHPSAAKAALFFMRPRKVEREGVEELPESLAYLQPRSRALEGGYVLLRCHRVAHPRGPLLLS